MQSINKKFYFLQTRICHAFPTNEKYMCLTFYISCITDKTLTRKIYTYRDILFHLGTFLHHITNVGITHKVFKVLFPFQNRILILWKKHFWGLCMSYFLVCVSSMYLISIVILLRSSLHIIHLLLLLVGWDWINEKRMLWTMMIKESVAAVWNICKKT